MAVDINSRYANVAVVEVRNPVTGLLQQPAFLDLRRRTTEFDVSDRVFQSDGSRHWAQLGLQHLRDAGGYWAGADLSGIVDPFTELVDGATLRFPSVERYLFDILPERR
jgi:hypothetical protein